MNYLHAKINLFIRLSMVSLLIGGAFSSGAKAQELSREEKKELLIEITKLKKNLPAFKAMKEQDAEYTQEIGAKSKTLQDKKAQLAQYNTNLLKEKDEAIEYEESLLRDLLANNKDTLCAFAVQIGAYQSRDLSQYASQYPKFIVEPGEDGLKKYSFGIFTSYQEARAFSRFLNLSGAQTYVVGFYSGSRVPDLRDMTECTF